MADVVISYSRADADLAGDLAVDLRSCGYDTWMDINQIAGGNFHSNINAELDKAAAVIVIWSDASCASQWVQAEAGRAKDLGKLIAVKTGSLTAQIPVPFSTFHTTELDDRRQIVRALGGLKVKQSLAESDAANAAQEYQERVRKQRRRDLVRVCSITACIAAAIPMLIVLGLSLRLSVRGGELKAERDARANDAGTITTLNTSLQTHAEELARPVSRIIVPYARGGPTHTLGELLARHFSVHFGRRIVAVPWEGQSGVAAAREVLKSDADGRTLLLHHNGLAYTQAFASDLEFEVSKALEPVGLVNLPPMAIVAHASLRSKGITDAKTLLDAWRKNPLQLRFGHAGLGSNSHLCLMKIVKALNASRATCATWEKKCWPEVTPQLGGTGPVWRTMRNWSAGSDPKDQINLVCDQINIATTNLDEDEVKERKLFGIVAFGPIGLNAPRFVNFKKTEFEILNPAIESWHGLYVKEGTSAVETARINRGLRSFLAAQDTIDYFSRFRISMPDRDLIDPDGHRVLLARVIEQADEEVPRFGGKRPISKF